MLAVPARTASANGLIMSTQGSKVLIVSGLPKVQLVHSDIVDVRADGVGQVVTCLGFSSEMTERKAYADLLA